MSVLTIDERPLHKSFPPVPRRESTTSDNRTPLVARWLRSLREQDRETAAHANRVSSYARLVGPALALDPGEQAQLELLAALHDIGKTAVSKEILDKPGSLSMEEWAQVKQHPMAGYRIAVEIPAFASVATSIQAHHERWDGNGYPLGLQGERIPLLARIVAVIDAFDVMISGRAYAQARTICAACEELLRCAGTQFDPQVTQSFVRVVRSNGC